MPQLDFNVALSNLVFLIVFFIVFYLLIHYLVFPRLLKMVLVRKFYLHKLDAAYNRATKRLKEQRRCNLHEQRKLLTLVKKIL